MKNTRNSKTKKKRFLHFLFYLHPLFSFILLHLFFLFFLISTPTFLSLGVMFVCLGCAVPLRAVCCYSGSNVITLYKLAVTEQEAPTDWWHFIVIALPLLTVHHSWFCCWGLLPSERERERTQKQQIEHITSVIQRKMINLSIKLLFWCYIFCCAFLYCRVTVLHKDVHYISWREIFHLCTKLSLQMCSSFKTRVLHLKMWY